MVHQPESPRIILASASPRRKELLGQLGVDFTVITSDVDESAIDYTAGQPGRYVETLAMAKADAVAAQLPTEQSVCVIGADTIVLVDDTPLGKPTDAAHAETMLKQLQGRSHQVITGIALITRNSESDVDVLTAHSVTTVWFKPMTGSQIRQYVATGEPMDKAGAYAIQGYASAFIPKIEGCYFNVVGLPLALLADCLRQVGISPDLVLPKVSGARASS